MFPMIAVKIILTGLVLVAVGYFCADFCSSSAGPRSLEVFAGLLFLCGALTVLAGIFTIIWSL